MVVEPLPAHPSVVTIRRRLSVLLASLALLQLSLGRSGTPCEHAAEPANAAHAEHAAHTSGASELASERTGHDEDTACDHPATAMCASMVSCGSVVVVASVRTGDVSRRIDAPATYVSDLPPGPNRTPDPPPPRAAHSLA